MTPPPGSAESTGKDTRRAPSPGAQRKGAAAAAGRGALRVGSLCARRLAGRKWGHGNDTRRDRGAEEGDPRAPRNGPRYGASGATAPRPDGGSGPRYTTQPLARRSATRSGARDSAAAGVGVGRGVWAVAAPSSSPLLRPPSSVPCRGSLFADGALGRSVHGGGAPLARGGRPPLDRRLAAWVFFAPHPAGRLVCSGAPHRSCPARPGRWPAARRRYQVGSRAAVRNKASSTGLRHALLQRCRGLAGMTAARRTMKR